MKLDSSANPYKFLKSIFLNWYLLKSLVRREVLGRYKGSYIGLMWPLVTPLFMLMIYTFVFGIVFQAKWSGSTVSTSEFSLQLYAGLMVFNFFSESISRAPSLVVGNTNYVKKIIFPLEILPLVIIGSAAFHFIMSLIIWVAVYYFFYGYPSITIIFVPIVLLPLFFIVLGLSWILASLGVFVKDVALFIGTLLTGLLFMSPVFYSAESLPEGIKKVFNLNPLTPSIQFLRDILFWGKLPNI